MVDEIVRPPRPRRGDLVRVVSPSLPSLAYSRGVVDVPVARLAAMGLRCDFAPNAFEISDDGRSAGTAAQRAEDLHGAFLDPDVSVVMSAVGGLASHELLPHLDADLLRSHPTAFVGRSDNTFLNAFLYSRAGLTSFTGASFVTQFGESDVPPETSRSVEDVLLGSGPLRLESSPVRTQNSVPASYAGEVHRWSGGRAGTDVWLQHGRSAGRLLGAEAGILADLLEAGLLDVTGSVLWLDVVDDGPEYAEEVLDRLWPLLEGVPVAALLVADNPSLPFEDWTTQIGARLREGGPRVNGPVMVGGDLGHYQPAWLLPYGEVVVVDAARGITIDR
ncbi:LD-carboxypeptidase [Aeromicrobium sp. SORGH_AS_0981]|uniref:LD-carboxypeptidase n=1 Tax=Aeromicrobium sp. SORGH_AS_0981 TaxID=3041802 RepID=UPI00286BCB09|nr:LD-carboxypeptidase [Aeromicrobium sp. SORGH_AS_0981]